MNARRWLSGLNYQGRCLNRRSGLLPFEPFVTQGLSTRSAMLCWHREDRLSGTNNQRLAMEWGESSISNVNNQAVIA